MIRIALVAVLFAAEPTAEARAITAAKQQLARQRPALKFDDYRVRTTSRSDGWLIDFSLKGPDARDGGLQCFVTPQFVSFVCGSSRGPK